MLYFCEYTVLITVQLKDVVEHLNAPYLNLRISYFHAVADT